MRTIRIHFILWLMIGATISYAQPKWHTNPPESSSGKYCYISIKVHDSDDILEEALKQAQSCLGFSGLGYKTISGGSDNGSIEVGGRTIKFQRVKAENDKWGGKYILFMFAKDEDIKKLPRTANKHFVPLSFALSAAIPGGGQFYKKEKGKGVLFMTTVVASAGSALYFESQRASNTTKFNTASSFAEREDLQNKIDQNITFRNMSAGVAGAIYFFNIVDAVFMKGKRYAVNEKPMDWNLAYDPWSKAPTLNLAFSLSGGNKGVYRKF